MASLSFPYSSSSGDLVALIGFRYYQQAGTNHTGQANWKMSEVCQGAASSSLRRRLLRWTDDGLQAGDGYQARRGLLPPRDRPVSPPETTVQGRLRTGGQRLKVRME